MGEPLTEAEARERLTGAVHRRLLASERTIQTWQEWADEPGGVVDAILATTDALTALVDWHEMGKRATPEQLTAALRGAEEAGMAKGPRRAKPHGGYPERELWCVGPPYRPEAMWANGRPMTPDEEHSVSLLRQAGCACRWPWLTPDPRRCRNCGTIVPDEERAPVAECNREAHVTLATGTGFSWCPMCAAPLAGIRAVERARRPSDA